MIPAGFKGRARRIDDVDLPRLGATIGVGEDEIHAVLDVESRGSGFDKQGRPLILFEPHVFYRLLNGHPAKQVVAVNAGLAYQKWRPGAYPSDSYPRLTRAMTLDETAALKACSWGLGQILGENHKAAGYKTVQEMVAAFCDDEEHHLAAMVDFIKANRLDRHLRAHDWAAFARGYNGPGYAKNRYDQRLAASFVRWSRIKDTPWNPGDAGIETNAHDLAPHVVVMPATTAAVTVAVPPVPLAPAPPPADVPPPVTPPVAPPAPGFWARFFAALSRRIGA